MTRAALVVVLLVASCGDSGAPNAPPLSGSPDDGGTITYTRVPNPNDMLNLVGISYTRDGSMRVTSVSGAPSITLGSVPGQSWFVFAGPCPVNAQGIQDITVVYPLYQKAVQDRTAVPVTTQPTPTALGLYFGAQLPESTCFEFVNCDAMGLGVCSFKPYSVRFG